MQQCSFSTMGVEQQHGSYATMKRLHPDYGLQTLAARGYLHSCRALFSPEEFSSVIDKLQKELTKLEHKQPHKVGGRSMFLQRMLANDELAVPEVEDAETADQPAQVLQQQHRLRIAQQLWQALPAAKRAQSRLLGPRFGLLASLDGSTVHPGLHFKAPSRETSVCSAQKQLVITKTGPSWKSCAVNSEKLGSL